MQVLSAWVSSAYYFLATFSPVSLSFVQLLWLTKATLLVLAKWADSLGRVPFEVEPVLDITLATNVPHLDGAGDVLFRLSLCANEVFWLISTQLQEFPGARRSNLNVENGVEKLHLKEHRGHLYPILFDFARTFAMLHTYSHSNANVQSLYQEPMPSHISFWTKLMSLVPVNHMRYLPEVLEVACSFKVSVTAHGQIMGTRTQHHMNLYIIVEKPRIAKPCQQERTVMANMPSQSHIRSLAFTSLILSFPNQASSDSQDSSFRMISL